VADLKAQWKKKGKEELHSFCENTKRKQEKSTLKDARNGSSPWFCEIKMNRRSFMSINHMTVGHTSLKASLNRFSTASTAECESGDGLQTEECELYKDQGATVMDILSENRKKEYPESVTELLSLEDKRFVQGVSYVINKIPIFI
jgi:hypothetical protein